MKPKEISHEHLQLMKLIGFKIKDLRTKRGISYVAMAKEIGLSKNAYNQLELGQVYFSISSLLKVLEYHNVKLSNFFSDL